MGGSGSLGFQGGLKEEGIRDLMGVDWGFDGCGCGLLMGGSGLLKGTWKKKKRKRKGKRKGLAHVRCGLGILMDVDVGFLMGGVWGFEWNLEEE